jgi:hypothetical protein
VAVACARQLSSGSCARGCYTHLNLYKLGHALCSTVDRVDKAAQRLQKPNVGAVTWNPEQKQVRGFTQVQKQACSTYHVPKHTVSTRSKTPA